MDRAQLQELFNTVMQLEHHKEELGHWSDCELDSEEDEEEVEEELQEMIAQLQHNLVIEQQQTQETTFGPPTDKSLLLCHQF